MRRPKRCKHCGYNYLVQAPDPANPKPLPEQKCPKCGTAANGFSLIELLVVIAIIGILAGVILVVVNGTTIYYQVGK